MNVSRPDQIGGVTGFTKDKNERRQTNKLDEVRKRRKESNKTDLDENDHPL